MQKQSLATLDAVGPPEDKLGGKEGGTTRTAVDTRTCGTFLWKLTVSLLCVLCTCDLLAVYSWVRTGEVRRGEPGARIGGLEIGGGGCCLRSGCGGKCKGEGGSPLYSGQTKKITGFAGIIVVW